jgi:flagellin
MRSQIRGLDQAMRNTGDGLSVLDTAESAIGSIQNLVQRLRELAIQAANGSNSDDNRNLIQEEVDQVLAEIDRLAGTVQFNGKLLLDGSFTAQRVQTGLEAGDFFTISIADLRTTALGQQAIAVGETPVSTSPIPNTAPPSLEINGVAIPATTGDGISFANADASALAKAAAINSVSARTGVLARAEAAVHQAAGASIGAVALDGTGSSLFINGVNVGPVAVEAGDSTGTLREAINSISLQTGVRATIATTGELVLTAEDGRNFEITTTGSVADEIGLRAGNGDLTAQVVSGSVRLSSSSAINVGGAEPALIGFNPATQTIVPIDPNSSMSNLRVVTEAEAQDAIEGADAALAQLNRIRARLGAITNGLEAAINNIDLNAQNLTASDSRIRDTDFAEATAKMTQEQILQQTATAILAQANLIPQMALRLLER